ALRTLLAAHHGGVRALRPDWNLDRLSARRSLLRHGVAEQADGRHVAARAVAAGLLAAAAALGQGVAREGAAVRARRGYFGIDTRRGGKGGGPACGLPDSAARSTRQRRRRLRQVPRAHAVAPAPLALVLAPLGRRSSSVRLDRRCRDRIAPPHAGAGGCRGAPPAVVTRA